MILDGLGVSFLEQGNAVRAARMQNIESYFRLYPCATLHASGIEVGLPWGEVGNSEAGHKNIGSGRIIYQPLPRITLAIQDGSFFENVALRAAAAHVQERPPAALHLLGLLSAGGVHSHTEHVAALLEFAGNQGLGERTIVHAVLDGQDVPAVSAGMYLTEIEKVMERTRAGRFGSLIGRHFAMDRNNNWDRTKLAYDLLVSGKGQPYRTWQEALEATYEQHETDQTTPPCILSDERRPLRTITDGDAVIFFNFRPDRARQLTQALVESSFRAFPTQKFSDLAFVTMADYGLSLPVTIAYPEEWAQYPVGRVVAEAGLRQLRMAETEKYAHVTYYFNSGRERPFALEDRILIPSPRVADYSGTPAMSAGAITERVIQELEKGKYDFIILNFANPDLLGHTGNFHATIAALRFLDLQIGRVVEATGRAGGAVLITCDHGNAEEMVNSETGEPTTDHSTNAVPIVYITPTNRQQPPKDEGLLLQILGQPIGVLADVGPTILDALQLEKPPEMTAQSLLGSLL